MISDKLSQVNDFMNGILHTTEIVQNLPAPAMTGRSKNSTCGEIYKIYINGKFQDKEVIDMLFMHEAGHIIFGHLKNFDTKANIQKMKVRATYSKVSKRFKNVEEFEKYFDKVLFNIVFDFEVNSKLFSESDYKKIDKIITNNHGFFPTDFDLPIGLDYSTYLNLILTDLEKFFKKMKDNMKNQNSDNSSGSDESDSNDDSPNPFQNDEDFQNGNINNDNNSDWEFSKKELKKLIDEVESHNEEKLKEFLEKLNDQNDNFNPKKIGNVHLKKVLDIDIAENFTELEKKLLQSFIKSVKVNKRDILYNYNRNKIGTTVLVPAIKKSVKIKKPTIYCIIDTSGSINRTYIKSVTKILKNILKRFGVKSRVIFCDTKVQADFGIKDNIIPISGGGTHIANGISYVNEKYNPKNLDILYVFSDYCDDIDSWNVILDKMKCDKIGILWDNDNVNFTTLPHLKTIKLGSLK